MNNDKQSKQTYNGYFFIKSKEGDEKNTLIEIHDKIFDIYGSQIARSLAIVNDFGKFN